MLTDLIQEIKTICLEIPAVKQVFAYPYQGDPTRYPAIIFYQDSVDNSFYSTNENYKMYKFKMFLLVNVAGKTVQEINEVVLPKAFDSVVAKFDDAWSMNTRNGHRVWARISANMFNLSIEANNKTASVEMTLEVKALTNN